MEVDEVINKYSKKIESQISSFNEKKTDLGSVSKEYDQFKQDMMPEISRWEGFTEFFGNIVKFKLSMESQKKIADKLEKAHLNLSPNEVMGAAFISFLIVFFASIFLSVILYILQGTFPLLFLFLGIISSLLLFNYLNSMPDRLAIKWKLKAGSQMIPAILYTIIYMKHTSNLERAINFISQHLEAPLSLDFKKILWDVETGKYSSIKDSLNNYLKFWKDSNSEFVESFHLIESSLYEPLESRRIQILEQSLRVILDGVYEKMLKYTHEIKSPLTNLYMLGVILPTLGLAMLPLASVLMGGVIKEFHVFALFNIIIPFLVLYLTSQIMLKRPGGHGETTLLRKNPLYYLYKSKKPYYFALLICLPIFLLGILPLIFGYTGLPQILGLSKDYVFSDIGLGFLGGGKLFGFEETSNGIVGPFSIFSLFLSLLIPLSISLFFIISFSLRSKELIKSRDQTKKLEAEFNSSLFTLGNKLGSGIPAELAFSKVAETSKGQKTENFFKIVSLNIQSMGMSLERAIFDSKRGALIYYPSNLIATSMKILIESVKKGLKVAAQSLTGISEYVRNLHKINERLKDLLAEIISDMKSNMTFLAPLLAGIVVGVVSMINEILLKLKDLTAIGTNEASLIGGFNLLNITELFNILNMIPPYFLQIIIGLYVIQIIFILTKTLVTINCGEDRLKQTYEISKNLLKGTLLYLIVSAISMLALSSLARIALGELSV